MKSTLLLLVCLVIFISYNQVVLSRSVPTAIVAKHAVVKEPLKEPVKEEYKNPDHGEFDEEREELVKSWG